MLFCDVFIFSVKQGVPSDEELEQLSLQLENWEELGRRLKIEEKTLATIDDDYREKRKKICKMLRYWKERDGSTATYKVLHDALCHQFVNHRDLAERLLANSNLPQFIPGNISLILQFNNNTITYKYSAYNSSDTMVFGDCIFHARC